MQFSYFLYICGVIALLAFVYFRRHERRTELERRISFGRIQIRRLLARNGRRLSQIGLRIERKFSGQCSSQASVGLMTDMRRRLNNDIPKVQDASVNPLVGCKTPNKSSILDTIFKGRSKDRSSTCKPRPQMRHSLASCQILQRIGDEGIHDRGDDDTIDSSLESKESKHQSSLGLTITKDGPFQGSTGCFNEMPGCPVGRTASKRSDLRRDSVMPVFTSPKELPRRKSVLPILAEEALTTRRPSVCKPAPPIQSLAAAKREVVIVKPPSYVCPRRSSVLFNSSLFAHSPIRRMPKIDKTKHQKDARENALDASRENCTTASLEFQEGCVWQSDVSRLRRRSSSGCIYKARRSSVISGMKLDSSITEVSEDVGETICVDKDGVKKDRRQSIPSKTGNYLTGNLSEFKSIFGPNAHNELWQRYINFGPLYQISALGQKIVFLFDHKDIDALKKAEGKCPKHMDFKHLRIYRQRNNLPLGVLLSCGDDWKRQRKILSKAMNSSVVQSQYFPVVNQVAKELMALIAQRFDRRGSAHPYVPEQDINNYAMEAFGRVLYGRDLNCLSTDIETDLHKFVKIAKSNFEDAKALMTLPSCLMLLHPAWRRHNEKWNFMLETTIRQALLSINCDKRSPCVLSHLVQCGEMTESEMLINLTDLLHASIDTTSTAIHWCLYELSLHKDSVSHIVDEYQRTVTDTTELTLNHLQKMTYLKAVIKETLRLHPVGFLASRTLSKPMSVRNFNIPPQANVMTCMYVMGRRDDVFLEPNTFRPERWMNNDPEMDRFYKDVPFGFGPRMCIGRRIAEIEIALFLLHFCLHFEFELRPGFEVDHVVKLLLTPSGPLELVIKGVKK